jgi:hypothetical protein
MLEQLSVDGIGEEAANIASPPKEFFKLLSKAVVELRFPERHLCNVLWAHETLVPLTLRKKARIPVSVILGSQSVPRAAGVTRYSFRAPQSC